MLAGHNCQLCIGAGVAGHEGNALPTLHLPNACAHRHYGAGALIAQRNRGGAFAAPAQGAGITKVHAYHFHANEGLPGP